jgi:hypothetical protein
LGDQLPNERAKMDDSGVDAQTVIQKMAMKIAKLEVQNAMLESALEKVRGNSATE